MKRPARKNGSGNSGPATNRQGARASNAKTAAQAKFPRHSVEKALRIPKAIYDQNAGKPTSIADAAKFTTGGKVNGPFKVEVSSAKKYGFLRSEGASSSR